MAIAAIFAADLHISDFIWSTYPAIRGDSFFAWRQLVDLAIKHRAPLVLAGDVLELMRTGSPTSSTVDVVDYGISCLKNDGIPLYYIHGQHDLASPSWLHAINKWAVDVNCRGFKIGGDPWYGIAYQEQSMLDLALREVPQDTCGLVLHQQWHELLGGSRAHGSLKSVFAMHPNLRAIVTGDLHRCILAKSGNERLVVSPGATHMRTVAEPTEHFAIAWENRRPRKLKLLSRPVVQVVVTSPSSWAAEKAKLESVLPEIASKALVSGVVPEVATPLLIIQEDTNVGAYEEALSLFSHTAHVMRRVKGTTADPLSDKADEEVLNHQIAFASRLARVRNSVEAWSRARFGQSSPTVGVMCGIFDKTEPSELRKRFFKEIADGDTEACPSS
ncbi:MAG: hypothetical protein KatS3mg109_0167 [Pirellulaceae bacterium]|nr:MAG: hypothetical protein KatS3mg109_0167 [Pirellulaceae bacterium]